MNPFHRFKHTVECSEITPVCTLEWESIGDDLWLRPAQEDEGIAWCYLGQAKLQERLTKPSRHKAVAKKIGKALVARRFWRYWTSSTAEGELFLRREFGLIRLPDKGRLARFNFGGFFKNADEVLFCRPQHLAQIVGELEEQKDFQEALYWLQNYEDEWANVYFERGSREQLEALMQGFWALFRPSSCQFEQWNFYSLEKDQTLIWHWPHVGFATDDNQQTATKRLFELLNEAIVLRKTIARHYTSLGEPEYDSPLQIRASLPSMHERVEALLLWREFLSDMISPQEIEELLPQH